MRSLLRTLMYIGLTGVVVVCVRALVGQPDAVGLVKLSEPDLWDRASATVLPLYPVSLLPVGVSGVGVAKIEADASGNVDRVYVLQAPAPEMAQEMTRALGQWKLRPVTLEGSTEHLRVTGRITFYFENRDGFGEVLRPSEKLARVEGRRLR